MPDAGWWRRARPKRPRDWLIAIVALLFGVPIVIGAIVGGVTSQPDNDTAPAPTVTATTTTTLSPERQEAIDNLLGNTTTEADLSPRNAAEAFEPCVSAWDGNHEGFEALIRDVLNDPGSMETHGTYYNASDSIADGEITIRLDYGARNAFGGMVRSDALGVMDIETCEIVEVITYGE